MEKTLFYIIAAIMIFFAIKAVTSRKMLRSVVYLLFVLTGVAGLYFMVDYTFMAAVQLAVYAGGVIVLIIFSVLLVHHIELRLEVANLSQRVVAALVSLFGISVTLYAIHTYDFLPATSHGPVEVSTIVRGMLSFEEGGFILPFEVTQWTVITVNLLVLAAAVVVHRGLVRERR